MKVLHTAVLTAFFVGCAFSANAQTKVYLNPSNQFDNSVAGGGNEAQYALIIAQKVEAILDATGFDAKVDQDFSNAPYNANDWGAKIFVSIHSNAGGGHGTETLYVSSGGMALAEAVQDGLMGQLPYADRGLKKRTDLHVLNNTDMYACLTETVFHDCSTTAAGGGHPPSESAFLKSAAGQDKIARGIANGVCDYYNVTCSGSGTVQPDPDPESPPINPTTGTLTGVVYKAPNLGDRISGATVKLSNGQQQVVGATGTFKFDVAPGTYTITASASGYQTNSVQRTVVAGQEVWGSVGLTLQTVPDNDPDKDGVPSSMDNCPNSANSDQKDSDNDGMGDACETNVDTDGDSIPDASDNCPLTFNPNQADADGNGVGNACQTGGVSDSDGDGYADSVDNCPALANASQSDSDHDGKGDACDTGTPGGADSDGDGVKDDVDNCTMEPNANQLDSDDDGVGNACDPFPTLPSDGDVIDVDALCNPNKAGSITCPPCDSQCLTTTTGCASGSTATHAGWLGLVALLSMIAAAFVYLKRR